MDSSARFSQVAAVAEAFQLHVMDSPGITGAGPWRSGTFQLHVMDSGENITAEYIVLG